MCSAVIAGEADFFDVGPDCTGTVRALNLLLPGKILAVGTLGVGP